MSRYLITGASGQLGSDLQALLAGEEVRAVDLDVDITDAAAVEKVVSEFRPDVILNAAAYTAVDKAEEEEETAYQVNAVGPANLAAAAARHGARLVHVSTDYVFAGDGTKPYEADDAPDPKSAYGRTKLAGEQAVRELLPDNGFVVRTAWVYGAAGKNFVKTMARLERERDSITVVDDQRGSPTWSFHLAKGLLELARSSAAPGTYHCTGGGDVTWCGFARAIFEELGADPSRVQPIRTEDYPVPAPRPAYSVLSDRAWRDAGLTVLPHWREALREAFATSGDAFRG